MAEILARLAAGGFEAVAVSLLWSVANPAHEERIGELLEELLPGIPHTLSHRSRRSSGSTAAPPRRRSTPR
ncbi:hypothetical protein GCM10009836_24710 [Pseudonocardia ailaonensis]|uniref:Hydantoinase/oxoprolinase N-terminal domain-containing protein n=1 Tax=Pseudonocardia ailaonensis TaxID=367279 RepID=A0ABN2MZ22_9PSEU